jgi:predicted amidohydrolase
LEAILSGCYCSKKSYTGHFANSGTSFGSVVGERTRQGREQYLQYFKSAIEVPSEATCRIETIAKRFDIFLVVPVIERDVSTLYCTVLFVHPTKGLLGKRRKLIPTAMERILWGQGNKNTLPLLQESFNPIDDEAEIGVKFGAVICWYE